MKTYFLIASALLALSLNCRGQNKLLVFTQPQDQLFIEETLPLLRSLAQQKGIELIEREASRGVPATITSTPAILFQSAKGKSIYAGRYTEFSSVENFIRTARLVAQQQSTLAKKQLPLLQMGRMKVAIPVKLTELQGNYPKKADLYESMKAGLEQGMASATWEATVSLQRSDRLFYLDLHPYANEEGELWISAALFSQFSCIDPVFKRFEEPWNGTIEDAQQLFTRIAAFMEQEIKRQLAESKIGDAYTPIPSATATVSWKELGLELGEKERVSQVRLHSNKSLPQQWAYQSPVESDLPALQFQFFEPLSRYAGEVRKISGELQIEEAQLKGGAFEVEVNSLTMGMDDLDHKVLKKYLKAQKFPTAKLKIMEVLPHEQLMWGSTQSIQVNGELELMRKKRPVQIQVSLLPFYSEDGQEQLLVEAQFSTNITQNFGIEGPDGPKEAQEQMLFTAYFLMKSK